MRRRSALILALMPLGAILPDTPLAASSCQGGGSLISASDTSTCVLNAGDSVTLTGTGRIDANPGILAADWSGPTGAVVNQGSLASTGLGIDISWDASVSGGLRNSGQISAGNAAVFIRPGASVDTLTNQPGGLLSGDSVGLYNGGSLGSLANAGRISGGSIGVHNDGQLDGLANQAGGVIEGQDYGVYLDARPVAGFSNSGRIVASGIGLALSPSASLPGGLVNSGTLRGGGLALDLDNLTPFTLTNTGLIDGAVDLGRNRLDLAGDTARVSGAISGSAGSEVNVTGRFNVEAAISVERFQIAAGATFTAHPGLQLTTTLGSTNAGVFATAGVVDVVGDYTQTGAGSLRIVATAPGSFGQMRVSGVADLSAGGRIDVQLGGSGWQDGDTLAGVLQAGTLVAPALTVTDNSVLWTFTAARLGQQIDLTAHRSTLASVLQAAPLPAVAGLADMLDTLAPVPAALQPVTDALGTLNTVTELHHGLAQLIPVIWGAQNRAVLDTLDAGIIALVREQLALDLGMNGIAPDAAQHVWLKPYGSRARQGSAVNGIAGYRASSEGLALGMDRKLGLPGWHGGLALAHGRAHIDGQAAAAQRLAVDTWQASVYVSRNIDDLTRLQCIATLGLNHNTSHRDVPLLAGFYSGEYDSRHLILEAEMEHRFQRSDRLALLPGMRLSYASLHSDAYSEAPSGAAALQVDAAHVETLRLTAFNRWLYALDAARRFQAELGVSYAAIANPSSISARFAEGGATFETSSERPGRVGARLGLGYQASLAGGAKMDARYGLEVGKGLVTQTASLNWLRPF